MHTSLTSENLFWASGSVDAASWNSSDMIAWQDSKCDHWLSALVNCFPNNLWQILAEGKLATRNSHSKCGWVFWFKCHSHGMSHFQMICGTSRFEFMYSLPFRSPRHLVNENCWVRLLWRVTPQWCKNQPVYSSQLSYISISSSQVKMRNYTEKSCKFWNVCRFLKSKWQYLKNQQWIWGSLKSWIFETTMAIAFPITLWVYFLSHFTRKKLGRRVLFGSRSWFISLWSGLKIGLKWKKSRPQHPTRIWEDTNQK